MIYDGKVYRNLESQVAYLTEVAKELSDRIEEVAANIPSKMIVEELPETGDPNITYYVGPKGTEPNLYYEVWVWVQEEPDGPFVWRELEDTDQVDLSGYLQKVETVTTYQQVYGKYTDGGQLMMNAAVGQVGNALVQRNASGQIYVPATPTEYDHATSKKFVEDGFVAKRTSVTTYPQAYYKKSDGTQDTYNMSYNAVDGTIMLRSANGQVALPNQTTYVPTDDQAVSKRFADGVYLAKNTNSSGYPQLYGKATDGTQTMFNANANPVSDAIPIRLAYGHIKLPNQIDYPPTDDDYAVSKRYVSAVVGQLIYHHDMVIQYTLTGDSDYVKIAAHSDNNSSTAYTSLIWQMNQLVMPDYAIYHHGSNDYMCSVSKLPRGLHQDEFSEPQDGFLLTYWDGSALQNVRVNGSLFNTPTVTDVVTTW